MVTSLIINLIPTFNLYIVIVIWIYCQSVCINLLPGIDDKLVTRYADFNKVGNKLKMANFTKGGRGKKAPYETVHYRIPKPLKLTIQKLANAYKNLLDTKYFDGLIVNIEEVINLTGSEGDNSTEMTKTGTKYSELKQQVQNWQKAIKNSEPGYKMRRADKLFEQIRGVKWN